MVVYQFVKVSNELAEFYVVGVWWKRQELNQPR